MIHSGCQHGAVSIDGSCSECGLVLESVCDGMRPQMAADYTNISCHDRSILKDMEPLDIPDAVKLRAEEIFKKLNAATKRGNRRKQLIFFCIRNAYNELGLPQDPKRVADKVGIKNSEMTRALSMCSEVQTGYKPTPVRVNALHFLPQYCTDLNMTEETTQGVVDFGRKILEFSPSLQETFPQKVAAGILAYYAKINGITIDKKYYANLVQLSDVTINNMRKTIEKLDNH